jgi:hypothetical protein
MRKVEYGWGMGWKTMFQLIDVEKIDAPARSSGGGIGVRDFARAVSCWLS